METTEVKPKVKIQLIKYTNDMGNVFFKIKIGDKIGEIYNESDAETAYAHFARLANNPPLPSEEIIKEIYSVVFDSYAEITTVYFKRNRFNMIKVLAEEKKNRLNRYRILASKLNHHAFIKLINEVGPGFENRKGGYTRVLKIPARRGDAAQMAKLEFLEWDKTKAKTPKQTTKKANTKTKSVKETKTTAKPQPNEKKVLNTKETKNEKRKT